MVKLKDSNSHLSLIFNDEVFGMEEINRDVLLERVFFLGICSCMFVSITFSSYTLIGLLVV